jgi:hypothetical protein
MIKKIIDSLNVSNGSNYKIKILKENSNNDILKSVLQMTYCKVKYTYGVSMKNVNLRKGDKESTNTLERAFNIKEMSMQLK